MLDSDGQTLVSVEKLNTFLSKKHIVKDLSFSLQKGQCLAIVGATGSGKSVAVKSLLQLINEDEGGIHYEKIVFFGDAEIDDLRATQIAMVFQNARMSLNPVKKCGQQIVRVIRKHFGVNKEEAKAKVLEIFKKVKIEEATRIYNSYPHEISGGELQRVMIAMSLSCNPQLIVLDEPTASLDKVIQYEIVGILEKLKEQEEVALIIISHDLEMIAEIADQVIHINEGEIIASQNIKDFFKKPESEISKRLIEQLHRFRSQSFRKKLNTPVVLNCEALAYKFSSGKEAFKGISLNVMKGETIGIVGESGSGKSSFGKCLGQVWMPSKGTIRCEERVCYIFQDSFSSMDPDLSVRRILNEVLRIEKNHTLNPKKLLEQVLLGPEILKKRISELSGGQRQRVNLARGLASQAKILVCDEITSGLDLNVQFEIMDLLVNTLGNLTKIFITHDISLAKFACHRLFVMKEGSIVNQGLTEDIFNNSGPGYTYDLINSIPKVKYFLNR